MINDLSIILTFGFGSYFTTPPKFLDLREIYNKHLKNRKKIKTYDNHEIYQKTFDVSIIYRELFPTVNFNKLTRVQDRINFFFKTTIQPILEWNDCKTNHPPSVLLPRLTLKEIDIKEKNILGISFDKKDKKINFKWNEVKNRSRFNINIEFESNNKLEELLEFIFINSLHDFPYNKFKKCDCGNWFIQVRKENECSKRCYMRIFSREYRTKIKKENSKIYQKELSSGKKRAEKSYKKN